MSTQQLDAPVLELENVGITFPSGAAFRGIKLALKPGECLLVLGDAGSGKSTLLKMVVGLLDPTEGKIRLQGQDKLGRDYRTTQAQRTRVGYVGETSALLTNLSIFDNVALPLRYHTGLSEDEVVRKVEYLLRRFELWEQRLPFPAFLSAANRKLAAIARALVLEPPLVVADALVDDLGPAACKKAREILLDHKKTHNTAFLVAGHFARGLGGFIDRVAWLQDGTLTPAISYEEANQRGALEFEY